VTREESLNSINPNPEKGKICILFNFYIESSTVNSFGNSYSIKINNNKEMAFNMVSAAGYKSGCGIRKLTHLRNSLSWKPT
jgi:hypothetical protein